MNCETVLPKNIRQIGEIQQDKKIYIEDYVMTFLSKKEKENAREENGCMGMLLGKLEKQEDGFCLFIRGACLCEENEETIPEQYFPDMEPVGYFVIGLLQEKQNQSFAAEKIETSEAVGPSLIYHMQEGEETLYWAEDKQYQKVSGYFIFYERNPEMQKYMAEHGTQESVEKELENGDQAMTEFRRRIKDKSPGKHNGVVRYMASSFLILTVFMLGVTIIYNYDKMRNMEAVLQQIMEEPETEQNAGGAILQQEEEVETSVPVWAVSKPAPETTAIEETSAIEEASATASDDAAEHLYSLETIANHAMETESSSLEEGLTGQGEEIAETEQEDWQKETESGEEAAVGTSGEISGLLEASAQAQNGIGKTDEITAMANRQQQSTYTIRYGDTLADISQKYYGTLGRVEDICRKNGIDDPNLIIPGQKIVLP